MVLSIVLSLSFVVLVSSNNGFQPHEVSNYQNIYTTLPANIPAENNPYLQINTAQNPITQDNLQPFNIRQILLNRILSSPPLQTIFEHNSKGYGTNSIDCNNNPIETLLRNNYEASTTDYGRLNNDVNTNTNRNKDNESNIETEGKRRKHKRRKNSKSKRKPEENINNHNHNDTEDNNKETSKRSKKRSKRPKQDSPKENQADNNENLEKKNTNRPKKRKNKDNETNTEDVTTENPKPRRRHKKKPKSDANATDTANLEQQLPELRLINDDLNLASLCEGITEECRLPRNLKQENIDIQKPVTNAVDNFPNSFSFKTFQHLYNNPSMTNFLANYENIYKNMLNANNPTNEPRNVSKKKPKNTRKTQRKTTVNNKNSTVTANDKITPPSPVNSNINETSEKPPQVTDIAQANNNSTTEPESLNLIDTPMDDKEKIPDKDFIDTETKDSEEPFLNYYDGYIDDYYPLFTDNAAYTANNREVYVQHLGDTKYYYTIDKNNPEGFGLPGHVTKEYNHNKKYDEIENIRPKEDIVQFRTPPLLEAPDFETRKVEIAEVNPEAYYNRDDNPKTSTYSPVKHTEVKKNGLNTAEDKNIETLFAKSKVAKYGTAYKPEENEQSSEEAIEVKEELNEDSFKDGGTTYVIAKSLGYRY
ncbi:unnamed protein product [Spodoptera littoralis]|uniref:Uncharacterized protein n=1 Tax=Spodoptera littoralis TaxID=7109 RepID=A0A9P0N654_SPOLI|nr:unnamed protein product [Spodoptera littoralis]CAH1642905.1 unnamed protein product [Spodoptera littoralis]